MWTNKHSWLKSICVLLYPISYLCLSHVKSLFFIGWIPYVSIWAYKLIPYVTCLTYPSEPWKIPLSHPTKYLLANGYSSRSGCSPINHLGENHHNRRFYPSFISYTYIYIIIHTYSLIYTSLVVNLQFPGVISESISSLCLNGRIWNHMARINHNKSCARYDQQPTNKIHLGSDPSILWWWNPHFSAIKKMVKSPISQPFKQWWKHEKIPIWVCLKIGYIPNYSHLIGIMIINHWV